MLFALDVGNSNIVLGLFQGKRLTHHWRIETKKERTGDELGVLIRELLSHAGVLRESIQAVIISSVVPPLDPALRTMSERYLGCRPLWVGPKLKMNIKNRYQDPREVGADRLVNAVAGFEKYRRALIIVDFGTATTFDYITAQGEYRGGAIAPGILVSNQALAAAAARLPTVDVARPRRVVGRRTVESIQAGIFYGYVGLVEGLVERIRREVKTRPLVIATGGLAPLIQKATSCLQRVESHLTLEGLRILSEWNRKTQT